MNILKEGFFICIKNTNRNFILCILIIIISACSKKDQEPQVGMPPSHSKWETTFFDDFKGDDLDPTKWSRGFGWGMKSGSFGEGIDGKNVYIQDGKLVLKLENRPVSGGDYASGAVNTRNKFYQKYGYFEAKIKVAKGMGFLNAFWSKSNDERWPPEIDFIEVLGKETIKAHFTVHFSEEGKNRNNGGSWLGPDLSANFHIYGCEWDEEKIVWYIDGIERRRTNAGVQNINENNQPFYIMLNVHIGHQWPGFPDSSTPWPSNMEVDWVKVYKKKES
jgi:beta-glucanase (GH16 family)